MNKCHVLEILFIHQISVNVVVHQIDHLEFNHQSVKNVNWEQYGINHKNNVNNVPMDRYTITKHASVTVNKYKDIFGMDHNVSIVSILNILIVTIYSANYVHRIKYMI